MNANIWLVGIITITISTSSFGQSKTPFSIGLSYGILNNYNLGEYQSVSYIEIENESNLNTSYYQVNLSYKLSEKQGVRFGIGKHTIGRELIFRQYDDILTVYPSLPCTEKLPFGNISLGYYYKVALSSNFSISASPDISLNINLIKHRTCYIPPKQFTGQYGFKIGLNKQLFDNFTISAKYVLFKSWNNILYDFTPLSTYNTLSQGIEFSISQDL